MYRESLASQLSSSILCAIHRRSHSSHHQTTWCDLRSGSYSGVDFCMITVLHMLGFPFSSSTMRSEVEVYFPIPDGDTRHVGDKRS